MRLKLNIDAMVAPQKLPWRFLYAIAPIEACIAPIMREPELLSEKLLVIDFVRGLVYHRIV